jgi:hypothetical protein
MIERVLVIGKHSCGVYVRADVLKRFGFDDETLSKLIDNGDEYEHEGKKYCFDIPDERAYN